ncbi:MAG: hypothetical protein L0229_22595 [Blastocatellia bacterium]|nr:hypothetical protein [Blastocatellia bacterium]
MSNVQRFLAAILPERLAAEMESESRAWMIRCECGFEQSVWESGGIRWKAKGSPRQLRMCSSCGKKSWHTISRNETT